MKFCFSVFKNQPEVVAISETKLIEGKISRNNNLDNHNFIHCDYVTRVDGVGPYIKNINTRIQQD